MCSSYSTALSPTSNINSRGHCPQREQNRLVDPLLERSDNGNAARLIAHTGARLRWCNEQGKWWIYDRETGVWGQATPVDISRVVIAARGDWYDRLSAAASAEPENLTAAKLRDWVYGSSSEQRTKACMFMAKAHATQVKIDEFDADPYLLNTPEGVLDVRGDTLTPPQPANLVTKSTFAEWDPHADSQLWRDFVHKITAGDLEFAAYLQRSLGLSLLGECREKLFWFASGDRDTGKSTLINAVANALGTYHMTSDAESWIKGRGVGATRNDLTRLAGARLVTVSEIPRGVVWDHKLIKQVTGGDPITARGLYEADSTFTPRFCLLLAANDRPTAHGDDYAFWRRMQLLPIENRIPETEQDRTLGAKLREPAHAAAILRWLVEGCRGYLAHGLPACARVRTASREYQASANRLIPFAEDCLVITPETASKTLPAGRLHEFYCAWAKDHAERRPARLKEWTAGLEALGLTRKHTEAGNVWVGAAISAEYRERWGWP